MIKKRVEVTFSEAEQDLWAYLEQSNIKKATLIKKALREHMISESYMFSGNTLNEDELEEKITAAVAKAVGKESEKPKAMEQPILIDQFGGKEF